MDSYRNHFQSKLPNHHTSSHTFCRDRQRGWSPNSSLKLPPSTSSVMWFTLLCSSVVPMFVLTLLKCMIVLDVFSCTFSGSGTIFSFWMGMVISWFIFWIIISCFATSKASLKEFSALKLRILGYFRYVSNDCGELINLNEHIWKPSKSHTQSDHKFFCTRQKFIIILKTEVEKGVSVHATPLLIRWVS